MKINIPDDKTILRGVVKAKYGHLAICGDEQVTYVGDGVGSMSKNE